MFNRKERRAIAQGNGRHFPMIEVVDFDSAVQYYELYLSTNIWNVYSNLFIDFQQDLWDFQDEFAYE